MPKNGLQPGDRPEPRVFYGYTVVVAGCLSLALIFSVHYAFGIFFTPISNEFGWSRAMTSGAFSLVWIIQGLLGVVMGGLNDKIGPRKVLTICSLLIGAGYFAMSQVHAIWQLYLFYGVLVGAGLGGTFVPLVSTTARWFVAKRGLMTGIVAGGVGLGFLIGPLVANWLIGAYGWRASYMALGSIVFLGVIIAAQFLRRDPSQMGQKPYGEEKRVEQASAAGTEGLSLKEAAKSGQFWIASAVFLCYGFTWTAVLLHLAPHVTDLGISATSAAAIVSAMGGVSILGKVLLGIVADKLGNKFVYIVSFCLMALAMFGLVPATRLWTIYTCAIVFGFAYGGLATAHSPLVAWLFGMKQHGLIFGLLFNGWTIGCAAGPIVAGRIFDVTHSYHVAFTVCGIACLLGLVLTIFLKMAWVPGARLRSSKLGAIEGKLAI